MTSNAPLLFGQLDRGVGQQHFLEHGRLLCSQLLQFAVRFNPFGLQAVQLCSGARALRLPQAPNAALNLR
jgi:hypothetical protein